MDKERLHQLIVALKKPVFVYQMSYPQTQDRYLTDRRIGAQKRVDQAADKIESLIREYIAGLDHTELVRWCVKHDRLARECEHPWETGQIEYRDPRIMRDIGIADFYHGG